MKIPLVGAAYKHPSIAVSAQRCVNMFFMSGGPDVDHKGCLMPTSGSSLLIDLSGSSIRCIGRYEEYVYAVCEDRVYKLTIDTNNETATSSLIGTMTTSTTGKVYMAANTTQIMWTDGSANAYVYTPGTSTFTNVLASDADFPGAAQVAYLDTYFVVNKPSTSLLYFSAAENALSWDGTDVATAESAIDNIVGLGRTKGEVWVFGSESIEPWYNAGNASGAPFSPRRGLAMRVGCGAAGSIVEQDEALIWLDNRGYIVQSAVSPYLRSNDSGYALNIISTEALTAELLTYSRVDDAIACGYNDRGHLMYQITFPQERKTWVYDQTSQAWHERTYYSPTLEREVEHLAQYSVKFDNLNIIGGINSGKLYIVKSDLYTDSGEYIRRLRTCPPLYEGDEKRRFGIDLFRIMAETGHGLQSGQGSDPQITMRYSKDGGHTWSNELTRSLGQVGEYNKNIDWKRLGIADNWVFEISMADPVFFSIIEGLVRVSQADD